MATASPTPAAADPPAAVGPPAAEPPPTTLAAGLLRGYYITPTLDTEPGAEAPVCLNSEAVFSLTSARPGNGIPQLLADVAPGVSDLECFWQSDGTAPHIISIQFRTRAAVSELAFFVDASADESYTPRCISVRSGTLHHDLEELRRFDLDAPQGWVRVPLHAPEQGTPFLHTWYLQVVVHSMQANGRDMHMRAFKVRGPPHRGGGGAGGGRARAGAALDAPFGAGLLSHAFEHPALHGDVR